MCKINTSPYISLFLLQCYEKVESEHRRTDRSAEIYIVWGIMSGEDVEVDAVVGYCVRLMSEKSSNELVPARKQQSPNVPQQLLQVSLMVPSTRISRSANSVHRHGNS